MRTFNMIGWGIAALNLIVGNFYMAAMMAVMLAICHEL